MAFDTKIKGFVIIYVLWFFTLIGFTLATLMSYVSIDRRKLLNTQERYVMYLQSLAYAKIALQLYMQDMETEKSPPQSKLYLFSDKNGTYNVYVEAEDGKLSLNLTDEKTLGNLFKLCGVKDEELKAKKIVRDRDLNNIEFRTLTQLLDFLTYEDYIKVKDYITVNFMPVNPNFADSRVLIALGMTEGEVQNIISLRKSHILHEKDIFLSEEMRNKVVFYPRSYLFRLKVIEKRNLYEINLILDRGGNIIDIYE